MILVVSEKTAKLNSTSGMTCPFCDHVMVDTGPPLEVHINLLPPTFSVKFVITGEPRKQKRLIIYPCIQLVDFGSFSILVSPLNRSFSILTFPFQYTCIQHFHSV